MGKIAGAVSCALRLVFLGFDQKIDLVDQWLYFLGLAAAKLASAACTNSRNTVAKPVERRQADTDLKPQTDEKKCAKHAQRGHGLGQEIALQLGQFGRIDGYRNADRNGLAGAFQHQATLMHQQVFPRRTLEPVLVNDADGGIVIRQGEGIVPQGNGAHDCAALLVDDLPVETGKDLVEARVGRVHRHFQCAIAGDQQIAGDLGEECVEFCTDAARQVPVEKCRKAQSCNDQGNCDAGKGEDQESGSERTELQIMLPFVGPVGDQAVSSPNM